MGKLDRSVLIKKGRVSIDGLDSLVETFRTLTGEKADSKLVSAMKYALKPLQEKVKALAPKKHKGDRKHLKATSGLLKRMISFKSKKYGKGRKKKIVGLVGPKLRTFSDHLGNKIIPAFYAHLVEKGTASHIVKSLSKKRQKELGNKLNQNQIKSWTHPGAKAKPFMEPALKAVGSEIFDRFAQKARELIQSIGVKKIKGAK